MHVGDQNKCECDADSVRVKLGVGQTDEQRLQHAGHGGLADPAQGQAGERDAELHRGNELVELLVELLDRAGADAVGGNELLQPGFADADQGEFRGHKKCVCRDEQNDRHDPQHNEGNHEAEILPSCFRRFRRKVR